MAYRRTAQVEARLAGARESLLDATVRLVAEQGWSAVTVAAVAAAAGVATGTVYRHLPGKDALCAEAFRRAAGRELDVVAQVAAATDGGARTRIEAALRTFADRALRGRRLAYALLAEPASPAVEAERLAYRRGYHALFRELLTAGVASGALADHDPGVLAAVLTGAMGEAIVQPLGPAAAAVDAHERRRVVDEVVACCLRALPAAHEEERHVVHP